MPAGQWNDTALIQGLVEKDEAAFRELVQQFQEKVRNTCYGFLNNAEDAEDTAQEVFIEAYRSIDKFRGDASLSTWIYRISVNKSLNLIQKNKRKLWLTNLTGIFESSDKSDQVPDKAPRPDRQMEAMERVKTLHIAIGKLPESQRIAFTLHHFEEMSYKDIAAVMDTSLSAVESLIFRAKKRLRKDLQRIYDQLYWKKSKKNARKLKISSLITTSHGYHGFR